MALARNQPCPCGSGRRFKHCCGAAEGAQRFDFDFAVLDDGGDGVVGEHHPVAVDERVARRVLDADVRVLPGQDHGSHVVLPEVHVEARLVEAGVPPLGELRLAGLGRKLRDDLRARRAGQRAISAPARAIRPPTQIEAETPQASAMKPARALPTSGPVR